MGRHLYNQVRYVRGRVGLLLWGCMLAMLLPTAPRAELPAPLSVTNQSPLIQIHGLPGIGRATLLAPGERLLELRVDAASHFLHQQKGGESLLLDGESYRYTLSLAYGWNDRVEIGLEIPYLVHTPGSLDSFIDDWHAIFNLPTGGRERVADGQLFYLYQRDGETTLALEERSRGLGDLRLQLALQLLSEDGPVATAVALRGSVKLPTGDSERLTGSGAAAAAMWLTAARQKTTPRAKLAVQGSVGLLLAGQGEVLSDQQRGLVGFGGLGVVVQPWQRVRLQLQADVHTPLYEHSQLRGIGAASIQLASGGALLLGDGGELELAVVEDIYPETAPDVVFHLAWRQRF